MSQSKGIVVNKVSMVRRYRNKQTWKPKKRERAKAQHLYFTPQAIHKLRSYPSKQYLVWDSLDPKRKKISDAERGLAILVNPRGTKSWRCAYYFRGKNKKVHYLNIGRIGETLPWESENGKQESVLSHIGRELVFARERTREVRAMANPKNAKTPVRDPRNDDPTKTDGFENAFKEFIQNEQILRRKNKSAHRTQSFVLNACEDWKDESIGTIDYRRIDDHLLAIMRGDSKKKIKPRPSSAVRLHAHLGDFFRYCARRKLIADSPMRDMLPPTKLEGRDRVYTDDELKAIYSAADKLDPVEGGYIKLMLMLALRKQELALAEYGEFETKDDRITFVVPTERVKLKGARKLEKRKPVYIVPLPKRAQRIFKSLPNRDKRFLFPNLDAGRLKDKLVKLGAPADFKLHVVRHTVATYFQNKGRSEWERGLILNHTDSGSVTAGYSHGYPVETKLQMLEEWAEHLEQLIQPKGVSVLR